MSKFRTKARDRENDEIWQKTSCAILDKYKFYHKWSAVEEELDFDSAYLWRVANFRCRPSLKLCRKLKVLPYPKRRPNWRKKHLYLARWIRKKYG